jgi:hypothetical protein
MTTPAHPPGPLTDCCQSCNNELFTEWDASIGMNRQWCETCTPRNLPLPDSGSRTQFTTGAVRDAMPGKGLPSMIPPCAIRALARLYEDGCAKYGRHNWMKGIPLSRYQDAIIRHTLQAGEGMQDQDHLASVMWNAAGWMWTLGEIESGRLPKELNDLPYYKA